MNCKAILILGVSLVANVIASAQAGSTSPLTPTLGQNGETNQITAGVKVAASYYNTVGAASANDDIRYNIDPSIGYQRENGRWGMDFEYQPGVTVSQYNTPQRNFLSQSLDFSTTYRFNPRWTMVLKDQLRLTSNPFYSFNPNGPTFTPTQSGTGTVLTPLANRLTETGSVDFTYQMTEKTYLGFGSSYSFLDFHNAPSGSGSVGNNLIGNEKVFGRMFVAHNFGSHHSVGLEYDYTNLQSFRGFTSRTITHSGLIFDQIAIRPNLRLALYAGPEYQDVHDQLALGLFGGVAFIPIQRAGYSYAAGASIDYATQRSTLSGQYSHRAGDGGGLIGSVELNQVTANYNYKFTSRLSADLGGNWTRSRALSVLSTSTGTKTTGIGTGVSYALRKDITVNAQYGFTTQERIGTTLPVLADRQRITVSVQYRFVHPLGR